MMTSGGRGRPRRRLCVCRTANKERRATGGRPGRETDRVTLLNSHALSLALTYERVAHVEESNVSENSGACGKMTARGSDRET